MIVVHCNCHARRGDYQHFDSCPMSWPESQSNAKPFPPDPKAPPPAAQCMEGMPYFDSLEEAQATDRTAKLQRRVDILETSVIEERRVATNALSSAVAKGVALSASNKSLALARAENKALCETLESRGRELSRAEENVRSLRSECARLNAAVAAANLRMKDAATLLKGSCTCGKPAIAGTHYFGADEPCTRNTP